VRIQCKQSDSTYTDFGVLDAQNTVVVLSAPGVFRAVRMPSDVSFGVDRS